jgi:hypothetical protein
LTVPESIGKGQFNRERNGSRYLRMLIPHRKSIGAPKTRNDKNERPRLPILTVNVTSFGEILITIGPSDFKTGPIMPTLPGLGHEIDAFEFFIALGDFLTCLSRFYRYPSCQDWPPIFMRSPRLLTSSTELQNSRRSQ